MHLAQGEGLPYNFNGVAIGDLGFWERAQVVRCSLTQIRVCTLITHTQPFILSGDVPCDETIFHYSTCSD